MSSSEVDQNRLIIPALGGLYEGLSKLSYPLIRVATGLFLMPHGAQKLFGWFGGYGLDGTGQFFGQTLGMEPGILFALLAGLVEFVGGLFVAIGLLTRPAALGVAVLMAVAVVTVHLGNGYFWTNGGYEYPLLWGLVALAIVFRGGGAYSVDSKLSKEF
ncbi:DoxX family protein [Aestuariispira ectoiniformans]|uniref:DoxX family protein n=1 Tax=Aestuariispira ectoiniformans TaxID=2775080 RepID=UPI00223B96F3|nr:DoxX family protein [Aestuariispira ectoiniformans]